MLIIRRPSGLPPIYQRLAPDVLDTSAQDVEIDRKAVHGFRHDAIESMVELVDNLVELRLIAPELIRQQVMLILLDQELAIRALRAGKEIIGRRRASRPPY